MASGGNFPALPQLGDPMSRNLILMIGALLWATFGAVAAFHVVTGDWLPLAFAALVGVGYVAMRHTRRSLTRAA